MTPLLRIEQLGVDFHGRAAITDVSLTVDTGESVALVGGSGAGKSTVARCVAGLVEPSSGRILLDGENLTTAGHGAAKRLRRDVHLVFQDPYASLPPTLKVGEIVAEPMVILRMGAKTERTRLAVEALESVRLDPGRYANRYAHELSGGERQRVAFARALVTQPKLILADEPTQMLDASLRVEMIELMRELGERFGVAILHITHDLALAQRGCNRVIVMQHGRVVEQGLISDVLCRPQHHYTASLVAAATRIR
ncbi:MAG: dipeptide/oligopeptide/nickel ABC transporter ATP-binding protein [Rhodococcus sp. (in: high G+C Gram-positive bacteria)]|uniref:ABC transporter ATP-binding protein n=1 Tax=Rhodococcus sp. TaxID=1831 RepID=UPI003BB170B0